MENVKVLLTRARAASVERRALTVSNRASIATNWWRAVTLVGRTQRTRRVAGSALESQLPNAASGRTTFRCRTSNSPRSAGRELGHRNRATGEVLRTYSSAAKPAGSPSFGMATAEPTGAPRARALRRGHDREVSRAWVTLQGRARRDRPGRRVDRAAVVRAAGGAGARLRRGADADARRPTRGARECSGEDGQVRPVPPGPGRQPSAPPGSVHGRRP